MNIHGATYIKGSDVVVKKIGKKAIKKVTNIAPKVGSKVKRGGTVTITVG
jgi:serine/threonine-protein kinase